MDHKLDTDTQLIFVLMSHVSYYDFVLMSHVSYYDFVLRVMSLTSDFHLGAILFLRVRRVRCSTASMGGGT